MELESFTTFMDIFERCIEENKYDDLTYFLKNSRQYFQGLTTEKSKSALFKLFNTDTGLLRFLQNELGRANLRKNFDNAIKEVFFLIQFIIENFHTIFHQYILPVKVICQVVLVMRCSMYIKKAAYGTLKKLIKTYNEGELDLDETVEEFVSKFFKLEKNERSIIISIFGTIAQCHPQVPTFQKYKQCIFILIFDDFKSQYVPSPKSHLSEIEIYLEALTNILDKICAPDEIDSKYYAELYVWLKDLSMPNDNQKKKGVMRAAIVLLSERMPLFREFVYNDYEYWYKLFVNLAKEKDINGRCGQKALEAYYNNLEFMLRHGNSEKDKTVFLYFKNLLKQQLTDPMLDPASLRLVVYGFSKLAVPCKRHFSNDDVKDIYLLLARFTASLCLRENVENEKLENISNFQEALSEILRHVSDVSVGQIKLLIKVSVLSIKRYPDFITIRKTYAVSSLIKTIINIASISKILLDEFLYNIIHDGVVWTCSHTLLIDAELQRDLHNLPERPICYKDYLSLWLELVKPSRYQINVRVSIAQQIFDKMIHVYIMLITKLNLNTRMREDCVLSDAALSETAENETDFRMFVNMVDFMVDIINEVEPFLLRNTVDKFFYKIIMMSYRYPMISGFYKLVSTVLKNPEIYSALESEDGNDTEIRKLVYKYLTNTLDQVTSFSNELLTACLYLIMRMPTTYLLLPNVLDRTIPAFKIAITMGLNDFYLASVILDTLEKWTFHLNRKDEEGKIRGKDFLVEIVPKLESFLESKETYTELLQDIIKSERKVIKRVTLIDDENSLENLQMRILLFLGSLDYDVLLDIVYKRALNTGATWDKKDLLNCTLPFPDLRIELHFDKIFPRLITLAEHSGDRRTKVTASELLHTMVAFVIGKTVKNWTLGIDRFSNLYKMLYPALLNLSCDSDEVVWKLFQPLTRELSHWLSSVLMSKSLAAGLFIDALFDGLCNDEKSSLREFSASCLAEFTEWSLKELSEAQQLNAHSNICGIIRKINNFALHPSKCKRIAAATAFNHLYALMYEREEIITVYWLELLYCFVKSLEGCNHLSIHNALRHVDKVIKDKAYLFNEDDSDRRKPAAFTGKRLTDAVNWLFAQCGSLDKNCREKSMEFHVKMSEYLDTYDPAKTFLELYIEQNGIGAINCVILKDLQSKERDPPHDTLPTEVSVQSMLIFLRSLDCYMWLIKKNIIGADYLFAEENPEKDTIFNCARNFIHLLLKVKVEAEDESIISREDEQLQTLRCETTITILDFIKTLLINARSDVIPDFFFNEELFELVVKCAICPKVLGFDMKNVRINERLPLLMEQLLKVLGERLARNEPLRCSFKGKMESYALVHCNSFFVVDENNDTISMELREYVKGLAILERCDIFSEMYEDKQVCENVERIFRSLTKEKSGRSICVSFQAQTIEYLASVMELFLTRRTLPMTRTLINLIGNDKTLIGLDSTEITHGEYFLDTFKDTIFAYILKDTEGIMLILENLLGTNASFALTILEESLLFAQRHKSQFKDQIESLVTLIMQKFVVLDRATNNIENRKDKLINICGISVHLMRSSASVARISKDFYKWILKEFTTEKTDIEYKTRLAQNFLVCLTDVSSTSESENDVKPELVGAILRTLRSDRLSLSSSIRSEQSYVDAMKIINCFYTLLTLLPVTRSLIVFETIILFAAGGGKYLFDEKLEESLKKYFDTVPSDCALKSIETAYKLFMDFNNSGNDISDRFDVLQKFLLPILEQFCKITEIERFYERNIKEIYTIIARDIDLVTNDADKRQLVISQIGCYELITIMFVKVDTRKIISVDSVITRNGIADEPKTGKELYSRLFASTLQVRSLKTDNPEHKEIMRLLHCSAYNCSIAIVSLNDEERAYELIFAEKKTRRQFIWENIVDRDKRYNIRQTVERQSKNRKKLVRIKKSASQRHDNANKSNYSYIYSYSIGESTVHEDLNAYDFNEARIISKSNRNDNSDYTETTMSLVFEFDELNDHECMPSISGLLRHMISKEIFNLSNDDNVELPKSLMYLHDSMITQTNNNVRLFLLKVILNTSQLFEHYGKSFLYPVTSMINSYLETNELNYVITDALVMLTDWHKVAVPTKTHEKTLAQKLFEKLVDKILMSDNKSSPRSMYRYNVGIIRTIVKVWQRCLKVPQNFDENFMKEAPGAAVHLILMYLVNDMQTQIVCRNDILEFLQETVGKWQEDEETVLQSCEALGAILECFKDDQNYSSKTKEINEKLLGVFRQMQRRFENRLIRCIHALCKNYPDLALEYIEFIIRSVSVVDTERKAICLQLFLSAIPRFGSAEEILQKLGYIELHDVLKNRVAHCEKVALQIVNALVVVFEASDLLPLAKLIVPYAKHDFSDYRETVYKIFTGVYDKYSKIPSDRVTSATEELIDTSKKVLLEGLLDPSTELQEKVLNFWTEGINLANKTIDRLMQILKIYSPNTEDVFLPFIPLTMLNLLTRTAEYKNAIFEPFAISDYQDYEIDTSRRMKNLVSVAPLFAPSLASTMNESFGQTVSSIRRKTTTMDLEQFESTYVDVDNEDGRKTISSDDMEHDKRCGFESTSMILQPAYNKRSQRFLTNSSALANVIKHREMTKNMQHREMIKEETTRQRSSVKLCRKYKHGDFPYIGITLADLTEPLRDLIKKDLSVCKDITVAMLASFIKAIRDDKSDLIGDIVSILKEILCNSRGNSPLVGVLLETMFTCHIVDCSPDITGKLFKANHFNSFGVAILFLEESLIRCLNETPSLPKRMRLSGNEIDEQTCQWILLADLYESINEIDIVLSIFRDKVDNERLKDSSVAQATCDWARGKSSYENAYSAETGLVKEHCLQGLFECLSRLSDWDEIDKCIKDRLDRNLENIWNDSWKNFILPWMFKVYAQKLLTFDETSEFNESLKAVQYWLEDEQKLRYIKRNFGEELALFFVNDEKLDARDLLHVALDKEREEWIHLRNPLSVELRKRKLQKLCGISDIDLFLRCFKAKDHTQGIKDLSRLWSIGIPSMQDDLLLWDKLVLYRTYFARTYVNGIKNKLKTDRSSRGYEENECTYELRRAYCQLSLDMVDMALTHGNKYIASKHFYRLKEELESFCPPQIKYKYALARARLKYLKGDNESVVDKKVSYYATSWKYLHKILNEDGLDVSLGITARQRVAELATTLVRLSYESVELADALLRNDTILKELDITFDGIERTRGSLVSHSFNKLKESCSIGGTKDCYLVLSNYCYDQLSRQRSSNDVSLFKEFLRSTLKAMSYGSTDATHYFPCLLKHECFNNDEIKDIFTENSNAIQSWLFLRWQAQLFSHLGSPMADLIVPIVERIIEDYPNAVIYTLRLTIETNPRILNGSRIYKIKKFLDDKKESLDQFLEAMRYVVQPEIYLQYYLSECLKNLSKGTGTAIATLLNIIKPPSETREPRPGNVHNMLKRNEFKLKKLERMSDETEIGKYLKSLNDFLEESLRKRKTGSGLLKDYSPWLFALNESDIEVPGQYTGYRKPMPRYHAKISKIEPVVKVMDSLRKPVRITMIGNDAKDYTFLNKFGEDLRLDQRLEETFSIINKSLDNEIACRQRRLFIDTYQVIPLSTSLGLIQWIKNTRPLKDLIYFTLSKDKYSHYDSDSIAKEYGAWIKKATPSPNLAVQYKEATLKYDAVAVARKMNELVAKTEWDWLRKASMILCPSPESFITFRRNFITSYATMCAVHWILGIGDRHLENILIIIGSGKCLGVDFNQAFGAGIDSMIPQLMPFRLTSQILGLFKPFTEKDLFGATMVHVLKALRSDKNTILACLDVFIHEPLNWTKYVNKALPEIEEEGMDVQWLPQKKISVVAKKLSGINPSIVTLEQLKDQHNDRYFERYYAIVSGNDTIKRPRIDTKNDKLTAEEQVNCLLDLATDLNILGRTYKGWRPWL